MAMPDAVATAEGGERRVGDVTSAGQDLLVDPERVSRMKQELASGNYCIDTNRVADKMIELEKLLKR